MAGHQFQPSSSWWAAAAAPCRPDAVSLPATPPFVSCSTVLGRSLNYYDEMTSTTSSSASVCNSSVTFQDHPSAPAIPSPPMDHFHAPHDYWSQVPFCGVRSENSFHGLLQEDVMNMDMNPLGNPLDISSIDQSSSFASPYALLHGLNLEQDGGSLSSFDGRLIQVPRQQLQFSGEDLLWNSTATATATAAEHHNLRPPPQPPRHQSSSSYSSNNLLKAPSTLGTKTSMENRKNSSEPPPKRTRIETNSSPLPTTFKVRKEKLGDRITALQQLVSPFGKTDTASVLHEAIDYIKFLHDQVRGLSAPYLKNGHPVQLHHQIMNLEKSKGSDVQTQDLRSRGLCLVPISSTFAVANEIPTDFWTPTFMGGALI
ncbi:transcription factor bHLH123-like isoform X2 [Curcuma longa]|uniref:transcription factor bHLH123-like isoform X2 n=1 Tax=Curcuma longa TaxID=136217 RepID=UPI003D9DF237